MNNLPQPIKDLGNATLTRVANKFVDFIITKYTGKSIKVFEAEANIEADKIKTKWEVLEKPFWLQAEAFKMNRQYSNMGKVLIRAAPLIQAKQNRISNDNDAFWGFLELSKEISNEEMQKLIAKIIAGEYNAPGTYSMSTLQIIKMLGKNELQLFEQVCGLLINSDEIPQDLFNFGDKVQELMHKIGVDFGSLQTLQNLGLFLPNDMARSILNPGKENYQVTYFDKNLIFTPENENYQKIIIPGFYGLSIVGKQILKHLCPQFQKEYYIWLKENYRIPNYKLVDVNNPLHPPSVIT